MVSDRSCTAGRQDPRTGAGHGHIGDECLPDEKKARTLGGSSKQPDSTHLPNLNLSQTSRVGHLDKIRDVHENRRQL